MSDDLFHDGGPESRNARGDAFEDQLAAMGRTLGWGLICRNVDVFMQGRTPSRGIDLVWAIRNPHTQENDGWVQEAKSHEKQAPTAIQGEVQALHSKVSKLANSEARRTHHHLGPAFKDVKGGILCHRSKGYDATKAADALRGLDLRNRERGRHVTNILYLGTDYLQAFADAVARHGEPQEYYWPPTTRSNGRWSTSCPPEQLALGFLAWKTTDRTVLWLKDSLTHHDVAALSELLPKWGINADVLICSELSRDQHRIVAQHYDEEVQRTSTRQEGCLPPQVEPRDLSYDKPTIFDDIWPAAA